MRAIYIILSFILLFIVNSGKVSSATAQYIIHEYKIADGLTSNMVNTLVFSKENQLLAGTQRGLCIFDGYRFVLIDGFDRNVESLVFNGDTLYVHETGKRLSKFIFRSHLPHSVLGIPVNDDGDPNNDHFNNVFIDNQNHVWVSDFENIKMYQGPRNTFHSLHLFPGSKNLIPAFYIIDEEEASLIFTPKGIWKWYKKTNTVSTAFPGGLVTNVAAMTPVKNDIYACIDDEGVYWHYDNRSGRFILQSMVRHAAHAQKILFTEKGNYILTSHHLLKQTPQSAEWEVLFEGEGDRTLNDMVIDEMTDIIWIASNNGLIQLTPPGSDILFFSIPSETTEYVIDIAVEGNIYYLLSNRNKLYRQEGTKISFMASLPESIPPAFSLTVSQDRLLIPAGNAIYEWKHNVLQKIPIRGLPENAHFKKLIVTSFNEWWIMQENQPVIRISPVNYTVIEVPFQNEDDFWLKNKWNDIREAGGRIWMLGWMPQSFGITYYNESVPRFEDLATEQLNDKGLFVGDYYHRIGLAENGDILMSAYGGWNRLRPDGTVIQRIDILNHPIYSDIVKGIEGMDNGDIVFGTSEGLYIYRPETDFIVAYTEREGMPANDLVYAFRKINKNHVAVGCKNGYILADVKGLMETKLLNRFEITDIRIDSILQNPHAVLKYFPDNNMLTIRFSALTYHQQNQVRYRYRYSMDKQWINIGHSSEIVLTHLPYGSYQIEIEAGDNLNNWQKKTLVLNIEAPPPFLKSTFFYFLLLGTGIAITLLISRFFIQKARKESNLQQKIISSEMKALRAQMNPHFLFNSLNSIHGFIIQEKTEEAGEYLTAFSKLLRYILEYTREDIISLEEELKALEIYLQLESARLEHIFEYSIEIDRNIDPEELHVPPLIIQPFVENAIWHGVRNIDYKGYIVISIHSADGGIMIKITDNGVGRQQSQARQTKTVRRKHFGMSITEDRVRLINNRNRITVTDLDVSSRTGTVVVIELFD